MGRYIDPTEEIAAQLSLRTPGGDHIDISGLSGVKLRIQLGAADEFTIDMPNQRLDGEWRSDMPVWQVGAVIHLEAGWNGELEFIQSFEITSTTANYPEGGDTLAIRGVSDLARAARNLESRTFKSGSDDAVITEICNEYGWKNGVTAELFNPSKRMKKAGKSDLDLLKQIAKEARIGGPRLTPFRELIMPEPTIGDLKYSRGLPLEPGVYRRLHSLQTNRDGGAIKTRVVIKAYDPETNEFVTTEFEANAFGGDPIVVYEGRKAIEGIPSESTTQGLTLKVVEHRGQGKRERSDILSSGRFLNETDAVALARRWFELREKLSRWSNIVVDGNSKLVPYTSISCDGHLASMDIGTWLPVVVNHTFDSKGWLSTMRSIRVVDEPIVTPTS